MKIKMQDDDGPPIFPKFSLTSSEDDEDDTGGEPDTEEDEETDGGVDDDLNVPPVTAPHGSAVRRKEGKKRVTQIKATDLNPFSKQNRCEEDPTVEFRFKMISGMGFKNFIDICRKINSEIEMVIFDKGITCIIAGVSSKYLLQTAFKREHFIEYYIKNDNVVALNIDVNDLFVFIKKINKNESFEMVKYIGNKNVTVKILSVHSILNLNPPLPLLTYFSSVKPDYANILFFPLKFTGDTVRSGTVSSYNFTAETYNSKVGIGGEMVSKNIRISSLFLYKTLHFLVKNKIGKICFRIFASGNIEIEGIITPQLAQPMSQTIFLYTNTVPPVHDTKIVDVVLPLNLIVLVIKFLNLNIDGVLNLIPINSKCFAIESLIFENVVSRFCLKGKMK
jgi:hypothetical protein